MLKDNDESVLEQVTSQENRATQVPWLLLPGLALSECGPDPCV